MEATQWIPGVSLGALGTSLRDSLSSVVSSCHAGSGSSGQSAALSPPVDCVQKGHQVTMVHLLEEDPSGRDMMLVAKELPAIVLVTDTRQSGDECSG